MKVGFIGLGIMGRPMAKNVMKAGHEVVCFDFNEAAVADVVEAGAVSAGCGRAVAEASDVVITMLPNGPDVLAALTGEDGIAAGLSAGKVFIDMSSIAPAVSRQAGQIVEAAGAAMIDAPVSGGEPGAIAGTIAIMVGGDEQVFESVKDLLLTMGKSATYVGPLGAGNIAKLANQSIVAVNIAVLAEALVLTQKSGVDPASVVQAIRGGLAGSAVMEQKAEKMLNQEFSPGFRINLHIKDLNNALATGAETDSYMPLTAIARQMMSSLKSHGFDGEDHSSLLRIYQQLSNTILGQE
ncbi:2-hydroxy-3-oxopropionate reductase [Actinomyces sp. B33]|uniref:2-hydroxy-3-oxopropionate reductase n=1 Tax=Actinomyces sp. B33 TaxID=2942131 RepID=UPI0023413260|nr:2-hydroxy-3-oxopropionate reductase [Actinomyces sp. B33]MDC4232475.1 2-hydroxy-3-oxopropionate reductase [Actinomyces sp. B33]